MLRAYCDESYKDQRVYAVAGYVARDRDWRSVARRWRNRCLRNGIECFHAADCESGFADFEHLSKEQRLSLKTDLIDIVDRHENLGGFSSALIIEDFWKVRKSSDRAKHVLGPDPYFLCFQMLLSNVCSALEVANPGVRASFIFENQEEFSGRAQILYDRFKVINHTHAPRMGTLTYASKRESVPLQVADNLAYETMKEILNNKFDPTRRRRISMERMIPRIRMITLLQEMQLQMLVAKARTSSDIEAEARGMGAFTNSPDRRRGRTST